MKRLMLKTESHIKSFYNRLSPQSKKYTTTSIIVYWSDSKNKVIWSELPIPCTNKEEMVGLFIRVDERQLEFKLFITAAGPGQVKSTILQCNKLQEHSSYTKATTGYLIDWFTCLINILALSPTPSHTHPTWYTFTR